MRLRVRRKTDDHSQCHFGIDFLVLGRLLSAGMGGLVNFERPLLAQSAARRPAETAQSQSAYILANAPPLPNKKGPLCEGPFFVRRDRICCDVAGEWIGRQPREIVLAPDGGATPQGFVCDARQSTGASLHWIQILPPLPNRKTLRPLMVTVPPPS